MDQIHTIDRRDFLKLGLGAGMSFVLGFNIPVNAAQAAQTAQMEFTPNAFLRIGKDNIVTIIAKHLEMGQGAHTGLATIIADELDADWEQVNIISAPADGSRYNNLFWGNTQGTGGSNAMANSWQQMREAGATARAMLISAAAAQWQVNPEQINVQQGRLSTGNQSATFGELVESATKQAVPSQVNLKIPDQFNLIGKNVPRKDIPSKSNGSAIFTQDIQLPNMLTALVAHPPLFGATPKSVDDRVTRTMPGVQEVVVIPTGVAVVAKDFWSAKKGRDALKIDWDESNAFKLGTEEIFTQYAKLADKRGAVARNDGDVLLTLNQAAEVIEAEYHYPYLAHACMEPMNCVVHNQDDSVEVWNGAQMQTLDQARIAELFGLQAEQVKINTLYAGGSFGRRANPNSDYVLEAANIAKHFDVPVKLVWTREDDMQNGWYRPLNLHRVRASLDKNGMPQAWEHRIVGQSIAQDSPFASALIKNGVDHTSVEGAKNLPYQIPNLYVDLHSPQLEVPIQWWRSVGSTHTAYTTETFIDQLAAKAGKDPVAYRLALLKNQPRHAAVLKLAAEKANWGKITLTAGQGRGVAVHESFNSFVAMVADVTVNDNRFTVDKVIIAVDCGIAINPDIIKAQMEGGMGFGLAMIINSEITLDKGRVVQSNFHDYEVLRINQMPAVEVHIISSTEVPTGVGEPATPVIAPAVANALTTVTGKRYYNLPVRNI